MGHFDSDHVQLMWPTPNRAELLLRGAHWGVPNSGAQFEAALSRCGLFLFLISLFLSRPETT